MEKDKRMEKFKKIVGIVIVTLSLLTLYSSLIYIILRPISVRQSETTTALSECEAKLKEQNQSGMVDMSTLDPMKCGIMEVECGDDGLLWFELLEGADVESPQLKIKTEQGVLPLNI